MPQDDLADRIALRYRSLHGCDADTIDEQVAFVRDWIQRQPELMLALIEAEHVERGLDFEQWAKDAASYSFKWTAKTDHGRAWLVWRLMDLIADRVQKGHENIVLAYSSRFQRQGVKNIHQLVRMVVEQLFKTLFEYLAEHLRADSGHLHALLRYVARIEWYDRRELFEGYEAAVVRNGQGEDLLNLDLRRFLFLDAKLLAQPFAEPKSATGEPDLVTALGGATLVCEGKIFDSGSRSTSYLAKGVRQGIEYARDHGISAVHLMIYNISDRHLRLHSDGPSDFLPAYVNEAQVRVYLHVVRLRPPATTASKLGKATITVVSRTDLFTIA